MKKCITLLVTTFLFSHGATAGEAPTSDMNIYLIGLHPVKAHPTHQMAVHHFCKVSRPDLVQCALFDGNTKTANLNGIEYIIPESVYNRLPEKEKQYWHSHNYEILSGQLVAPWFSSGDEKELMRGKMNSYGKTWHVWNTGHFGANDADSLPLGEPELAWSFNHDGEANPEFLKSVEKEFNIDMASRSRDRQDFVPIANPQGGVNALYSKFPGPLRSIPGVIDIEDAGSCKAVD